MKCEICGKEIEKSSYAHADLCSSPECFKTHSWNERLDETAIIIDGECYHDGGNNPHEKEKYLGFGGTHFKIQMNDGTVIETNNLWYGGKVPEDRHVKDNAVFIRESKK